MKKLSFLLKLFAISLLLNFFCSNVKSLVKADNTDLDISIEFRGFAYGEVLVKGLEWRFSSIIENHSDSSFNCNLTAYFSADEYLDASDTLIVNNEYFLSAGNSSFREVFLTLDQNSKIIGGVYYLIVIVDENQLLSDNYRDNNVFIVPIIIEDNPTDVLINDFEVPSVNINTTNSIKFDYKLTNTSNYVIYNVDHSVYISNDSILDYDEDIELLNDRRTMEANESKFLEQTRIIPEGLSVGEYFLIIDLDKDSLITEIDEENNQIIKKFQLYEAPIECDINLIKNNKYPKRVFAGEKVYLNADIENNGNILSYTNMAIYLSSDSILGSNDFRTFTDRHILSPDSKRWDIFQYASIRIPNDAQVGKYYIICTAESDVETETTDNNIIVYSFDVIEELDTESSPDFEIYNLTLRDSVFYNDYHIGYDFSYCNTGGEIEQEITLVAYLSNDSVLDEEDLLFEGSRGIPTPRKNDSINTFADVYIPTEVTPGNYYVIFKIDGNNIVNEIDEDNNLFVQKIEVFEKQRNLYLKDYSYYNSKYISQTFIKGVEYNLNISVLSDDLTDGDTILISYLLSDTIAVNGTSKELIGDTIIFRSYDMPKLTIPLSVNPGKYFLRIEANTLKSITENNLNNNYKWIIGYVLENNVELQMDSLKLMDKSIFTYEQFEAEIKYSNLSNNYFDQVNIRFYLSEDIILDAETDWLISDFNPILTCFEKKIDNVELSIQSEIPSGDYYILCTIVFNNGDGEINKLNNTSFDKIFIKPNLGDFIIYSVEPNSDTLIQGQNLMGGFYMYNAGNRYLDQSYTYIFISEDSILDQNDIFIDSSYCLGIRSYFSEFVGFNIDLPVNFKTGNDYLIFSVDHNNKIEEVSDTNNIATYPIFLKKAFIDLYLDSVDIESDKLGLGVTIEQEYGAGNKGNTMVDIAQLNVYLSKDTILEKLNDALLNSQFVDYVEPNSKVNNTIKINIPSNYDIGKAYLIFDLVITEGELIDSVQENNRYIKEIEIQEADHNLVCEWSNNEGVTLLEGNYEAFAYAILNKGNTDETGFTINVYLSSDSIADVGDTLVRSSLAPDTIYGGNIAYVDYYFTAPYGYSGEYYLIIDIVSEHDLAFEKAIHRKLILEDGYLDFSAEIWTCPRIVYTAQGFFEVKIEMQNNGDVRIINPRVELYYSADSILDDNDYLAKSYWQAALTTTYNNKVPFTLPIPLNHDNINYILLVSDPDDDLKEENEENNFEHFALNFVSEDTKGDIQFQDLDLFSDSASNYLLDYTINKGKYIVLDTVQIQVSWCSDTINPVKNILSHDTIYHWGDKTMSGLITIDSNLIDYEEANYLCVEILENEYDTVLENNITFIPLQNSTQIDYYNLSSFAVYPNPFNDQISFTSELTVDEVKVYSLQGMLILNININHSGLVNINLEGLKSGEYIINIVCKDKIISKKIIKKK